MIRSGILLFELSGFLLLLIDIIMPMLATSARSESGRARRLAYLDPVVHLPHLRALNRALQNARHGLRSVLRAGHGAVGKVWRHATHPV